MTRENAALAKRLRELVAPVLEAEGLVLWGVETASEGSRPVIRVYIDAPEAEDAASDRKGVTVDQCAAVSRQLSLLLDVEDVMPHAYVLEVSSPGLERLFFSPAQMAPYVGREISVALHEPKMGRKRFKGVLDAVFEAEGRFAMTADPGPKSLAADLEFAEVKKVRLVHHFQQSPDREGKSR